MWHSMKLGRSNMEIIPASNVLFSKSMVGNMGWTKINVFTEVSVIEQILQRTRSNIKILGEQNVH